MRTHGLSKRLGFAGAPLALLAGLVLPVSCSKTTTYSYVDVNVQVDPSVPLKDLSAKLDSCEVQVSGAESVEGVVIPCVPNAKIGYDLGTFEWTTTLEKGQLVFTITLFTFNREVYGTGTSAPVDIVSGKRVNSAVVVVVAPSTMTGTGGAGGGAGGSVGTGGLGGRIGGKGGSATGGAGGTIGTGGVGDSAQGGKGGSTGAGGSGQGGTTGLGGSPVGGLSGTAGSSAGGSVGGGAGGGGGGISGAGGGGAGGDTGGAGGA